MTEQVESKVDTTCACGRRKFKWETQARCWTCARIVGRQIRELQLLGDVPTSWSNGWRPRG